MSIQVMIGIAETEIIIEKTLEALPKSGEYLTLEIDGNDERFEVVDVDPDSGFSGEPRSYRIYVKPVNP
ncbi:hypothetical protein [uncultured Pantoea sp.]|uniref:hypothetical protein n=1 Tax=uncultured Pantoea sp. TaxID=218084 RepID=UPI00258CC3AF|nr:hypothetical protein [uncultured Pantoea sp.]